MSKTGRNVKARLTAATLAVLAGALLTAATAAAASPTVVTEGAKEITPVSITLCGTVNPEGEAATFHFVYEHYEEGWQAQATTPASAGAGSTPVEECTNVTGLKPETPYWYRMVAQNASGESVGVENNATTPTAVEELATEAAGNLRRLGTTSEATLNGTLAPNGHDTHYYFEYQKGFLVPGADEIAPALPGADAGEAS